METMAFTIPDEVREQLSDPDRIALGLTRAVAMIARPSANFHHVIEARKQVDGKTCMALQELMTIVKTVMGILPSTFDWQAIVMFALAVHAKDMRRLANHS